MSRHEKFIDIGQRLKAVRKLLKVQQKEMAESLQVPSSYLCEIENGRGNPGPDFFLKLFSEYNISPNYLLLGSGDMFIGVGDNVRPQEFDINHGIDSTGKLFWLMEESIYFKSTIISFANKTLFNDEAIIKKSMKKNESKYAARYNLKTQIID